MLVSDEDRAGLLSSTTDSTRGCGAAHLEIEDSGPGIPPEDRLKILEPYFTKKAGGTGLGLASRICQEHQGALEVDVGLPRSRGHLGYAASARIRQSASVSFGVR